jgi:hypothetical protein
MSTYIGIGCIVAVLAMIVALWPNAKTESKILKIKQIGRLKAALDKLGKVEDLKDTKSKLEAVEALDI